MIIVEISVPMVSNTYDFSVNEDTRTEICIEEIAELIKIKEGFSQNNDVSDMVLIKKDEKRILDSGLTLKENGVLTGDTLILV